MKRLTLTLAALVVLVYSASALAAIPVEVTIGKGTVLTLKKYAKRVSLTDPSIADLIVISPSELLINGKKAGITSLITWDTDGNRTFFDVKVFDGNIGEPEQVVLQVRVAQIDRSKLRELGISALAKGIDGGNAEGTIGGLVGSPGGVLGGGAGLNVTPGIQGFDLDNLVPQIGVSHFPSGVSVFLKALAEKGLASVLAEPNLVVRSGENGSFLAGSRVPIQQVSGIGANQTVTIVFEEVGVKLNFSPTVLETGTIRLKIDPAEVSNIARFVTFPGVVAPEIDTREVRTSVDLKEGESLILAGLLSDEMKKNIQKIPLLGDIPILGALFRSTREELQRTELAFFITPHIVSPMQPGEEPELPTQDKISKGEQNNFRWIPLMPSGDYWQEKEKESSGGEQSGEMAAE